MEKKNDLCERLFEFAVKVIDFLKTLPYSPENRTIRTQLSKSPVRQEQTTRKLNPDLQKLILKIK